MTFNKSAATLVVGEIEMSILLMSLPTFSLLDIIVKVKLIISQSNSLDLVSSNRSSLGHHVPLLIFFGA